MKGKQHTVRFHVDDILSSHEDAKVNDEFHQWLNETFGKLKEVTVSREKVHTLLSMELNFFDPGKLKVKQTIHVQDMIDSCPIRINSAAVVATPAGNNLMQRVELKLLHEKRREAFHTCVTRGIFIGK